MEDITETYSQQCEDCRNVRRTRSYVSVLRIVLYLSVVLDIANCASIPSKKEDTRLSQCQARCLQGVSRQRDFLTSECKGNAVCSKCMNYCSLLIKKSHVKRKLVCDRDRHLCDEGCTEACSFFVNENETYDEASDKAFLKKKQKKMYQIAKMDSKMVKLSPETSAKPTEPTTSTLEPKILPDWKISLSTLEKRGSIVEASITWDDINPAPSDIYTPDPVLAFLGMANGKYRLHWSCNNLEGQLVTDSTSATVSMWPNCKVLVNVVLLGYNLQSKSIVADTGSDTVVENKQQSKSSSSTIFAEPHSSSNEAYSSPVRFEPVWKSVLYIVAGVEVGLSLIVCVALLVSRRSKQKQVLETIPVDQPTISCIIVK